MIAMFTRAALRRAARAGVAGAALLAAVHGASADEGGIGDFLSSIFGARPAPQVAPAYAPGTAHSMRRPISHPYSYQLPRSLTVRLNRVKARAVAETPTKPAKVSILEDRTLRRGDAVMTARGVRVFAGSNSFPYRAEDFVSLKESKSMDADTAKQLARLDNLPRG